MSRNTFRCTVALLAGCIVTFATRSSYGGVGHDQGPNQAEAIYNPATGELFFDVGSNIGVIGVQTAGLLIPGNVDFGSIFGAPVQSDANVLAWFSAAGLPTGEDSVGLVLPTGLVISDVQFSYTPIGQPTVQSCLWPCPEPSSITLLVLCLAGGLLRRRRRQAA